MFHLQTCRHFLSKKLFFLKTIEIDLCSWLGVDSQWDPHSNWVACVVESSQPSHRHRDARSWRSRAVGQERGSLEDLGVNSKLWQHREVRSWRKLLPMGQWRNGSIWVACGVQGFRLRLSFFKIYFLYSLFIFQMIFPLPVPPPYKSHKPSSLCPFANQPPPTSLSW